MRLEEEAKGDGSDAGGAAAVAAAAAAKGDGKGDGKADPSLLSQGADAAAQAAAAADAATKKASDDAAAKLKADPYAGIPEKFRVFDGEGDAKKLNLDASAKKGFASLAELEKRMKDTGLPPAAEADYKFVPPKGKEALDMDVAGQAKFRAQAHAMGLTQKQYQGVMEAYIGVLGDLAERGLQMGATKAAADLEKVWGPQAEPKFQANLALAFKAFNAFADEGDKAAIDQIGNNPIYLRVLAKIGRELREDTGVGADAIQSTESIDQLRKSEPWVRAMKTGDTSHPMYAETKRKIDAHDAAVMADAVRRAA